MKRITVDLADTTLQQLIVVAERDRRHPRDQAAIYVERELRRDSRSLPAGSVSREPTLTIAGAQEGA